MSEVLLDTVLDGLKLLPFLFMAFLIIELIEHKLNSKKIIKKSGKFGPLVGSLLGIFPQCGFGVLATNLYATRIITLGTLISIYLSTSDEMLPIMISKNIDISIIVKVLIIKVIVGMVSGFIIDFLLRKKKEKLEIKECCEKSHCDCKHGIIKSTLKHTFNILFFIMLVSFLLNTYLYFLGEENLAKLFMKDTIFGPFISSLVGLIPNCAASVVITELYLESAITTGSLLAGLLTGSGVGLMVLFKTNNNLKQNVIVLFTIYGIGVFVGLIIDLLGIIL